MSPSELRYGFLTGIICILISAFANYLKLADTVAGDVADYVIILVLGGGAYMAVKQKRTEEGVLSFGKTFFSCMVTCFVASMMLGAFAYVYEAYIEPNHAEAMVAKAQKILEERKDVTPAEIAAMKENVRNLYSPKGQFVAVTGLNLFYGLFASLIVSVFIRGRKEEIPQQK